MAIIDCPAVQLTGSVYTTALAMFYLSHACIRTIDGEAEFWFASLKVFGIVGLMLMVLVLVCGGGPSGHALGFHHWHDPGPIKDIPVERVGGGLGRLRAFVATMSAKDGTDFLVVFAVWRMGEGDGFVVSCSTRL